MISNCRILRLAFKGKNDWLNCNKTVRGKEMFQSVPISTKYFSFYSFVADRIVAPKDDHVLIPRTCECITLMASGISQMWLRILTWTKDFVWIILVDPM